MRRVYLLLVAVAVMTMVSCNRDTAETSGLVATDNTFVENAAEPTETDIDVGVGGGSICTIHNEAEFHRFMDPFLLEYIGGEEEYVRWRDQINVETSPFYDDCPVQGRNMKAFIDYFDIPRSVYEEFCLQNYIRTSCAANVDLLYSEDIAAIEEYYRDEARTVTQCKQNAFNTLKGKIVEKYYGDFLEIAKIPEEERTELETRLFQPGSISMLELLKMYNVDRATFEELDASVLPHSPNYPRYDYNLELVYNEDGSLKDYEIDLSLSLLELDAMFAGVENLYTD